MCENDEKLRAFYRQLRAVPFAGAEKPSVWENLTDVLEILAVYQGIKPAHLNGCGLRSERLLAELEPVARKYGLETLRSRPHLSYHHREPSVARGFLEWQRHCERQAAATAGEVLWIYRDPARKTTIERLLAGRMDETQVLGYPACCVRAKSAIGARLIEALVEGYQRQHGAVTVADLIRCSQRDLLVALRVPILTTDEASRRRFPFVQFVACAACLDRADSPAAQRNAAMQHLASVVDGGHFARQIQAAARREWTGREVWGGPLADEAQEPLQQAFATGRPRRNDRCPCTLTKSCPERRASGTPPFYRLG